MHIRNHLYVYVCMYINVYKCALTAPCASLIRLGPECIASLVLEGSNLATFYLFRWLLKPHLMKIIWYAMLNQMFP